TPIAAGTALPAVLATVDIASGAAGSLETQASLTDAADLASGATATAITEVTAPPVLALSTSGTPDEGATAGTSYTLTFRPSLAGSPGGPAYSDPILAATLPSGETFVGTPSRSGWDCSLDGIGSAARGTLETQASLADPSDMATTAVADATVDVTATPVLAVTTSGAPGAAAAGTSYSLTLSSSLNDAPAGPAYHQPTLTATLPSGEMFAEAPSVTGWSCELSDGSMVLSCDSTSAPIAAGASLAGVTATVDIASSALGTYQAAVSLTDPADLATAASATASVDVTATPVLELSTSGTPATAAEGSHYTLNVSVALSSLGGPIYNQLVVGVMLSPGETFAVAPSVTGWSCWLSDGGTLLGCMRTATTSVNPGTSLLSLSVQVEVSSTASGTMTTAIMAADSADGAAMAFTTVTTTVPVDTPETGAPAGPSSPWGLGMLLAGAGLLIVLEVTRRRRGGSDAHRA
ncbi:MAG: hypothetical protein ABSC16_14465, partial [Candidatus Dormibacteria bacterium]